MIFGSEKNNANQKKSKNAANQGRDSKGKFTEGVLSPATPPTAAQKQEASANVSAFMERGKDEREVRYDIAEEQAHDPTTSPATLIKIVEQYFIFDRAQWTLECVASNPNTTPETLAKLATHNWSDIRTAVAANPNTLSETFDILIEPPTDHPKEYYSKVRDTSFEEADEDQELAIEMYYGTLARVASNPNVPAETLFRLHYVVKYTGGVEVDRCLALNPNSPLKLLSELGNGGNAYVREGVALNPNTHEGLLMDLAEDGDAGVRKAVIANPTSSEKTKEIARNYRSLFGYNLDTN